MARKLAAAIAALALMLTVLLPAGTLAADGPVKRQFERRGVSRVNVNRLPLMLDKARQVTVMLELGADPVLARGDQSKARQKAQAKTLKTRPLCAYPKTAQWDGKGSTDQAASFSCKKPAS